MTVQMDAEVTAQLYGQVRVLTDRAEIGQLRGRPMWTSGVPSMGATK